MFKGFGNIVAKEIKELIRDPKILLGMILVPLVMFPVLGGIMSFSIQSAQESAGKTAVLVWNRDQGENSTQFIAYLNSTLRVFEVSVSTPDDAVPLLPRYNATEIIEIPKDFSENITAGTKTRVKFYSTFSGGGMLEDISSTMVDALVEQFNRYVAPNLVVSENSVIIKGKIVKGVDPSMVSRLMVSQFIAMPITIMILLTFAMQIAATSVAMEKEEKTLETLLSLPIDRFTILMGKLSGSIIVAAVGAVTYMVGFNYYMGSFTSMMPTGATVDLASLGLVPSVLGYLLLGISLFVSLLSALALAVILSAFAEDVRGAQSLVGFVYPFLFIPSLLLMYLDVNALPLALKIVIYAIPYSHPILAARAVTMGDLSTATLGIVYVTGFTLAILYVASRLFATEKILTVKLRFRGLRRRRKKPAEELQ